MDLQESTAKDVGESVNGDRGHPVEETGSIAKELLSGLQHLIDDFIRRAEEDVARILYVVSEEAEALLTDARTKAHVVAQEAHARALQIQQGADHQATEKVEAAQVAAAQIKEAAELAANELQRSAETRSTELFERTMARRKRLGDANAELEARMSHLMGSLKELQPEPDDLDGGDNLVESLDELAPSPDPDRSGGVSEIWTVGEIDGQPKPIPAPGTGRKR